MILIRLALLTAPWKLF